MTDCFVTSHNKILLEVFVNTDDLHFPNDTAEPESMNKNIVDHNPRSSDQQCNSPTRPKLTRTQRTNRRHRANRYRYEVIRPIYARFTITEIKRILMDMNIYWININVVRQRLFIGLKNDTIRQHVDNLLHVGMFTEEHYLRLYEKRRQHHSKQMSTRRRSSAL